MGNKMIMVSLAAVCILIGCIQRTHAQAGTDLTVVAGEKGTAVVEATVQKITLLNQNSPSLLLDNRFIRRIAWVETDDGTASLTYSDPDYHGGIWRVDRSIFDITLSMYNQVEYSDIFMAIVNNFGISWIQTTWKDCCKPLYSALAARLFFHSLRPEIPPGWAVQLQAEYWNNTYHSIPSPGAVDHFIQKVNDLESDGCNARGIDLVFLMDGSGSVGPSNFNTSKTFVQSVVNFFDIGIDRTHVGVIQYSSDVRIEFHLNEHTEKSSLQQAIANITYHSGGTNTAGAISLMANESFQVGNGARPLSQGFPRVAVVITDGRSNSGVPSVFNASENARDMNIVLFAIGVTSNINADELNAIANKPNETYVFHVVDFDAISTNIGASVQDSTCNQAAQITASMITSTIGANQTQTFQLDISKNGTTISLQTTEGNADMFGSATIPKPNAASNDFHLTAVEGEGPVEIFVGPEFFNSSIGDGNGRRRRQVANQNNAESDAPIGTLYITIEGQKATNVFSLMTAKGDVTQPKPKTSPPLLSTTKSAPDLNGCGSVTSTALYVSLISLNAAFIARLTNVLY